MKFSSGFKNRIRAEIGLVRKSLSDLIFPPFCPLCEQELTHREHLVCEDCFEAIHTIEGYMCRKCGAPIEQHRKTCLYCKGKKYHFNKVRAFGIYAPPLSEMVHLLKYERKTHLSHRLGIFLANLYIADSDLSTSSAIIPVPLHSTKMRERGYNQSQLLAQQVAEISRTELLSGVVIRKKPTRSQTALKHSEREANLKNAFSVVYPNQLAGKSVTIVDDVLTSGTTINEMAKTILDAGAERVYGLVLARALSS
jgi:competence protein ComFC